MKKIYLATPYTGMEDSAFEQVNSTAASLIKDGYCVYSPISHWHIIAKENNLPKDWNFWASMDKQFIEWCDDLYVLVPKEGYDKVLSSSGVQEEIEYAIKLNKTISIITNN